MLMGSPPWMNAIDSVNFPNTSVEAVDMDLVVLVAQVEVDQDMEITEFLQQTTLELQTKALNQVTQELMVLVMLVVLV